MTTDSKHTVVKSYAISAISLVSIVSIIISGLLSEEAWAGPPPAPSGKKWVAVPALTDEFDQWDPTKWHKPLWNYPEPVMMLAENSGVTDGKLWIKATLDDGADRWFETSRVMSNVRTKFPMYIECSMKAAHISAFNTFWLNNGDISNRDEIDICENNSKPSITSQTSRPFTMYSQYFVVVDDDTERNADNFDSRNLSPGNGLRGVKWNEAYQTLGAWWIDKNTVQFYLNGEPSGRIETTRDFTLDQNVIWDLWTIDEPWLGGIAIQSDLLDDSINTMYVDWIHTYELVDDTGTPDLDVLSGTFESDQLIMEVAGGQPSGMLNLLSSTDLSNWGTEQARVRLSPVGLVTFTRDLVHPREFYQFAPSALTPLTTSSVDFTNLDYSDGSLDGQQDWQTGAGWSVTDSANQGKATTSDNFSAAVINQPISLTVGQTYSFKVNFQLTGSTYSTPTEFVYAFQGGVKEDNIPNSVNIDSSAADANIQIIQDADTYRLLNGFAAIDQASSIQGMSLDAGDYLVYDFEITLGDDAASTSYTVRLQNLTDASDTGWGRVTGIDPSIYSALTGTGAYAFFQTVNPSAGVSGLTGVEINSVITSRWE